MKPDVVTPPAPKPKTVAELFLIDCRAGIDTAKGILPGIAAITEPRSVDNTLVPLNALYTALANVAAKAGLYSEVHPDPEVQTAARTCEQEASAFMTDLMLDRTLYDAIAAVALDGADADTQRFATITLRDFRRAGVDKDEATRSRLKQIDEEMTKLGQDFSKNIAADVRAVEVASADALAGLPEDFIAAHPAGADGKIKITTDYPDYLPFMTYAEDDGLRKDLYVKFRSRGDAANEQVLADVLTLRSEKAMLLGYDNWADYITEDKMIKSGKAAGEFIERVAKLAKKRAAKDYAELLKEAKTVDKSAKLVEDWQKAYLENRVKKNKYSVDSKEVRPYFPYQQTLQGLLDITSAAYDIQYVPAAGAEPWHADVVAYDVMRGDAKLGRIYLDMHPREHKYKHAAQFTVRDGVAGVQLPEGALVCNFAAGNELMEHDDVVTMFHEFGHLMHHVLGGNQRWIRQSGVATEQDFVEAPSQMFEEWAWNHETLARFAKNEQGQVIPAELVARMRKADKFGIGTQTVQQMFYASISLRFHQVDPDKLDQLAMVKDLQGKYTPFRYVEGTRFHASFGHLIGYSAVYYTYMWSLVIAKDMLSAWSKKSLMDTAVTYAYRDKVLAAGGTKDAADLVKDFLGRPYNTKAFEKYLAE
ncbi:MAG: Zn-dependent oligopeptidase [Myxococcales bacterium]|nr:Zn-dependent oligopeptidase [Myxococcales bacterium]